MTAVAMIADALHIYGYCAGNNTSLQLVKLVWVMGMVHADINQS